ncbi:methyltransferase domain-containing protein [Maritalea sp.]|uniref:methyltransferase domain-containing protein n=1 Tax=Maritalea sp. TaxID=2003361 RepID=UPI0039E62F6A
MLHKMSKQISDEARVAKSFRRGLESYERSAIFQQQIAIDLVEALQSNSNVSQFDRALEFGVGTGFLTRQLVEQFQISNLFTNDLVAECASKIEEIAPSSTFITGPIQDIVLPNQCDLVASSSAIQWIPELASLIARLSTKLNIGGWLALSGFGPKHFYQLQEMGSRAAAPSYADTTELENMLPDCMQVAHINMCEVSLEFDDLATLLRHLRDTGVNGRADGMLTKSNFKQFELEYADKFARDGKLQLTYQPVRIVAQRKF